MSADAPSHRDRKKRPPRPLEEESLRGLALRYVERYATTQAKLQSYLARKLRERGWEGGRPPDLGALTARFVELGYVDDRIYGEAKARSLSARGYGARRVEGALREAGVDEGLREEIGRDVDDRSALLTLAKRRRFGPWAKEVLDRRAQQKQFAAMARAGHSPDLITQLMQASSPELLEAEWNDTEA
ncbi:regulatory protein RecX [Pacificimonas sp. ICDLI1SI03]